VAASQVTHIFVKWEEDFEKSKHTMRTTPKCVIMWPLKLSQEYYGGPNCTTQETELENNYLYSKYRQEQNRHEQRNTICNAGRLGQEEHKTIWQKASEGT